MATIPGRHPRLLATGSTAAYLTFSGPDDFEAAKRDLTLALLAGIQMRHQHAGG